MPRRGSRSSGVGDSPGVEAALELAVRFLGTRPRTRWEVERRLRRTGAEEPVIAAVLDRLAGLGYVDDAAFARWWGEQRDRHAPRGRRLVEAELRAHGVPRDVIAADAEDRADPERPPGDEALPGSEEERARDALERHLRGRRVPTDPKSLQRLGMFLLRRGFDRATVRSAIATAGAELEQEDE